MKLPLVAPHLCRVYRGEERKMKVMLEGYSCETAQPIVVVDEVEASLVPDEVRAKAFNLDIIMPGIGEEVPLHT
jgi:hypothetical protein